MKNMLVIISWLSLSLFSGVGLSALGAGTLAWPWVAGSTCFMAMFFAPMLALCDDGSQGG